MYLANLMKPSISSRSIEELRKRSDENEDFARDSVQAIRVWVLLISKFSIWDFDQVLPTSKLYMHAAVQSPTRCALKKLIEKKQVFVTHYHSWRALRRQTWLVAWFSPNNLEAPMQTRVWYKWRGDNAWRSISKLIIGIHVTRHGLRNGFDSNNASGCHSIHSKVQKPSIPEH